jgi:RNA polymerase sigma-70 factor (ECF subfamily)
MRDTDLDLAHGVARGDEDAFSRLHDRYATRVKTHLVRIVRDPAAADDLVQETFLRLWDRAGQWNGDGSFRSWLLRIATNMAFNHLRTVRRRREQPILTPASPEDTDEDESPVPAWMIDTSSRGPDQVLEQAEQRRLLRRFVGALSEEKQEVFRMIHDEEMETREVAETLGIPEGTVKSRIHHARRQIAREWRQLTTEGEED